MKRMILAAEESTVQDMYEDKLKMLAEDFDYTLEGLHKLGRSGQDLLSRGQAILDQFKSQLDALTADIAQALTGGGE